jgi:NhaP-type Na+/H+ or K+/H+ antiporter
MTARKFTNKNLSNQAKKEVSLVTQLLAYLAETTCFLFLGFSVASQNWRQFFSDSVGWALLLCFIGRALNVYPLLFLV